MALAHHQMHPASAAVLLPCYHSNRFPHIWLAEQDRADMSHMQRAEQHLHTSPYAIGSLSFIFWALNIQILQFYFRICRPTCLSHDISSDQCVILHILEVGILRDLAIWFDQLYSGRQCNYTKTMHCTYSATAQLKMHTYVKIQHKSITLIHSKSLWVKLLSEKGAKSIKVNLHNDAKC